MKLFKEARLSEHCSFRIGGVTELFTEPANTAELIDIVSYCCDNSYGIYVLGYGANTLFPDNPPQDICFLSTKKICGFDKSEIDRVPGSLSLYSGTPVSLIAIAGVVLDVDFDFTYLLPGSIGASVYMNARYMEREMKDIISEVHFLDLGQGYPQLQSIRVEDCEFDYKRSVFQGKKQIILGVNVHLPDSKHPISSGYLKILQRFIDEISENRLNISDIRHFSSYFRSINNRIASKNDQHGFKEIETHRDKYHHFDYPSAGSVFENSRELGKPIGAIVDELGLKGRTCGDAMVSGWHGNIIINRGAAKEIDVLKLIDIITEQIFKAYGFEPKLEIKTIKGGFLGCNH